MIFTFWEGQMPAYIKLCLETWKLPYTMLNYENLNGYTDLDIVPVKRFTLPQIADVVRVHVLRDQGGYWLDADTVMLTGKLPDAVILGNPDKRTNSIGMLHAERHSEMFIRWAQFQDEIINRTDTPTHWATMGNAFTDPYLQEYKDIPIGSIENYWPETYMVNDCIPRYEKYLRFYFEQSHKLADIRQCDLLMLHNSWTPTWYKMMSRNEVMDVDCTLSNILREIL